MVYLESFQFPSYEKEDSFLIEYYRGKYNLEQFEHRRIGGNYPFGVLSVNRLESLDFEPITILYGGNGSGKSTALNVIAEKLKIKRNADYNRTVMTDRYVAMCKYRINTECKEDLPPEGLHSISKMITSDDVFKIILGTRDLNKRKLVKKELLWDEIGAVKSGKTQRPREINLLTEEGLDELNRYSTYKRKSFVHNLVEELGTLHQEYSNGETGMSILAKEIEEDGLYLLDEPENSMSCVYQQSLARLIQISASSCSTQFIIATHAPFLLAIPGAKIYNLDANPVTISNWYELENMQKYYQLFDSYSNNFKRAISAKP